MERLARVQGKQPVICVCIRLLPVSEEEMLQVYMLTLPYRINCIASLSIFFFGYIIPSQPDLPG